MVYKSKLKRGNQKLSNETLKILSNEAPEVGVIPLSHETLLEMSTTNIGSNDLDPATDIVPVNSDPQFKYNQKIAAILASVSGWSYADLDDFQRILSDDEHINLAEADFVEITARNDSILIVAAAQIIRTCDKKTAIVCFRGTEPMNPVNWGTDLNVSQVPYLDRNIMVHRGFLDNFRSVWDGAEGILSYLKNPSKMTSDYNDDDAKESKFSEDDAEELENIYFTGHSLGGAMAFLAGLNTSCKDENMWSKVRGIYTYGQPLVIHPDSANRCEDLIGDCLFRHVYFNDIVPHVPPRSMGRYAHIGREFRYRPHELHSWQEIRWGKVSQIPMVLFTLPFMLGDAAGTTITAVPLFPKSPWSIIDHLPIGYMNSLNATSTENAPSGLLAVAGHVLSIFFPGVLKDDDVRDPIITDNDENEPDHTNDDDKPTNTIVGRLRNRRDKRVQEMIEYRLKRAEQHGKMIGNRIKEMISSTPQAEKLRNMTDFIEGKKARFVRARKAFHVLTIILVFYLVMLTISYY